MKFLIFSSINNWLIELLFNKLIEIFDIYVYVKKCLHKHKVETILVLKLTLFHEMFTSTIKS